MNAQDTNTLKQRAAESNQSLDPNRHRIIFTEEELDSKIDDDMDQIPILRHVDSLSTMSSEELLSICKQKHIEESQSAQKSEHCYMVYVSCTGRPPYSDLMWSTMFMIVSNNILYKSLLPEPLECPLESIQVDNLDNLCVGYRSCSQCNIVRKLPLFDKSMDQWQAIINGKPIVITIMVLSGRRPINMASLAQGPYNFQ